MLDFTNCTLMYLDTPNTRSGNIYPRSVGEQIITELHGKESYGQFSNQFSISENVEIDKITHKVFNLRISGNNLVGDVTFLDTPYGVLLQKYIMNPKEYGKWKFVSRGLSEVDTETKIISAYKHIAFDVEMI